MTQASHDHATSPHDDASSSRGGAPSSHDGTHLRPPPAIRTGDFLLVVLGAVLWGTGGLAGSALATASDLDMLTVATYRLGVGGPLLLVVLAVTGRLRRLPRSRAVVGRVVATGCLAALYQSCYFAAVSMTSVSTATLVALGAAPVIVAGMTAVIGRRRPAARVVVAVAVSLVGLVLLVGAPTGGGSGAVGGVGLALVSATGFATMTVLNRTPVPGLDSLMLTGSSFTLGALVLLPLAAVSGGLGVPHGGGSWALVVYLGVGPTAIAYAAYFAGLRSVPATTAALLALLEPFTASVAAAIVLDERLGLVGVVGGLLLAVAVAVVRPRRGSG
jgi:DME family drug/metabolite transporter